MLRKDIGDLSSACLTLSADARLSTLDYMDDQTWEIVPGEGEPASLSLQTTYGLRARWMRLFPRFIHKRNEYTDPFLFHQPARSLTNYPNYLSLEFSPAQGINVQADYWAPESNLVTGRFRIINAGVLPETIRFEWVALLNPTGNGEPMTPARDGTKLFLGGFSSGLYPACVLSDNPTPVYSPYPAMSLEFTLFPGDGRDVFWALASLYDPVRSRVLAEQTLKRNWDAEYARIEMENERRRISISTGNPDWDRVFDLSQKVAGSLVFSPGPALSCPSFVLNRLPDHGFSPRKDGLDHPLSWQGQDALSAYYLTGILLPGNIDLVVGILRNYFTDNDGKNLPDWRPGLAGQRTGWLAFPILASLAEKIDRLQNDPNWLSDIYPALLNFHNSWFSPDHDQDLDGWPEWTNPLQAGLDDIPLFARSNPNSVIVPISSVETPLLAALLYHECRCLVKLASRVGDEAAIPSLEQQMKQLTTQMEESWDGMNGLYRYRDANHHQSPEGTILVADRGSGSFVVNHLMDFPQPLLITINRKSSSKSVPIITLAGEGSGGATDEEISASQYSWFDDHFYYRTRKIYHKLLQVTVDKLDSLDEFSIRTINLKHEDISQLVPLWAGIMDGARAREMLHKNLTNKFLGENGISLVPPDEWYNGEPTLAQVVLPWNLLIGEGLLANGERQQAADLVIRIMHGIIQSLRTSGCFKATYHSREISQAGNRNSLAGLAPLGLFLESLGLEKISKGEIIINGYNPYPFPVTVQYAGIKINCEAERVTVAWPSGEVQELDGVPPHRLLLPETID